MPDLQDGESAEIQGSARLPYVLKNIGGVYSCSCPAWRNQSLAIEVRTCKHLRAYRGEAAEQARTGGEAPARRASNTLASAISGVTAPRLLLAHTWQNDIDLDGWWMSEKLDGVRAYWDGHQFISRLGNVYHAPEFFLAGLPSVALDGELWLARKAFQRCCLASSRPEFAEAHRHDRCRGLAHLREELGRVETLGGEGLMLRQPGSHYEAGRSSTLLKVKTFHDAEARVVEHSPGSGRHKGRLGALAVELPDGTSFSIGTGLSDAERERPPAIGSIVTFRYQELSDGGVPRFPSFVGIRNDAGSVGPQTVAAPPPNVTKPTKKAAANAAAHKTRSSPSPQCSTMTRHFEYIEGNSAKFWEISPRGNDVTVRFGRIGTQGQTQTKTLPDADAAERHVEKLIGEKTKKGYVETGS